ncbi:hypothetical protein NMY3_02678 [Candidatus Nitrosocosmicus oleophilus]|uniref:Uncharacterized protein n=1 Tax=Candidatus Nitrosocosmicus oleophilus TaxID=1353260 RepID=A0A654LZJ0_9ARCH|nr:hypothetical protein [Candidatus Nitrosocosmicus oleophilus]ALI36868.1 hypothetical protein NMY3_02678 [Candidatus Nitrosocosmicus oleophilus]
MSIVSLTAIFAIMVSILSYSIVNVSAYGDTNPASLISNISGNFKNASDKDPTVFSIFKFENDVLKNITKENLGQIKHNFSQVSSNYLNQTLDELYNANLKNESIESRTYSNSVGDNMTWFIGYCRDC